MNITNSLASRNRRAASNPLAVRRVVLFVATLSLSMLGSAWSQTQYTNDGAPTPMEEEIRWRLNRGRFDSASENQNRGTSYTDILPSVGPLTPNQCLAMAARRQSEDMAKQNVFQHTTVTGSAYYDPITQPEPWDRMEAEGYVWVSAAENIAAGYSSAETAYVGWWNSAGHRANMYGAAVREIGNGYYYWANSTYGRYYTMDLGSDTRSRFFSDTVFRDINGNGVYDAGEGIPGVAILLKIGVVTHSYCDVSAGAGSFAIPIQTIATGVGVTVVISNTTSTSLTLNIPTNYTNFKTVVLGAGQAQIYGAFVRPADGSNVGFRNVSPATATIVPTLLQIAFAATEVRLNWASQVGLNYQPQWSSNFLTWNNLTSTPLAGTGGNLSCTDAAASTPAKLYRVRITLP